MNLFELVRKLFSWNYNVPSAKQYAEAVADHLERVAGDASTTRAEIEEETRGSLHILSQQRELMRKREDVLSHVLKAMQNGRLELPGKGEKTSDE